MKPTVYLAGPMTGTTLETMTGWRNAARSTLEAAGWRVLSPVVGQLSGKNAPTPGEINLDALRAPDGQGYRKPIGRTSSAFVSQDRLYVKMADAVLANTLGATERSIGTIWEIAWADAWDKLLVTVVEPFSIHDHGFIRRNSSLFVPTMEEALEYLVGIVP